MKAILKFLFFILILGVILWWKADVKPFAVVDRTYAGWLSANAHRMPEQVPLALVQIDNSSLQTQNAWPWKPLDYALFFQTILPFHPAVIGVVPPLEWKKTKVANHELTAQDLQYTTVLHDFLLQTPKLLLASKFGNAEDSELLPPMQEMPTLRHVRGDVSQLPAFNIVTQQAQKSLRLAGTSGFTNLNDGDSEKNTVPLLLSYRGEVVPSFVLEAAMLWLKLTPDDVRVELGKAIRMGNRFSIPIDRRGNMQVNFHHRIGGVGFGDLLLAASQTQAHLPSKIPRDGFHKKLVLLARTDSASKTVRFANGEKASPGELFAQAIATIQSQSFIREAPMTVSVLLILLALVWGALALRIGKLNAVMASLFLLVIYLLACLAIFQKTTTLMPLFLPAGLLVFIVSYCLVFSDNAKKSVKSNDGH